MADNYVQKGPAASFTPIAELDTPVDYLTRTLSLGRANFPTVDSLKVGMAALVEDEFMQVTALGPGTVAVKRGVGDTVPAKHAADSLVWFVDSKVIGNDRTEYAAGTTTGVKYSPFTTGGGSMPIDQEVADNVTFDWRFFRPYPPGKLKVNTQRWYEDGFLLAADHPTLRLTWAHRDRLIEADQMIDHDVGNIGPEPGTTYTVRIYDAAGVLRRTEVGIMAKARDSRGRLIDPSWTYSWRQAMSDFGITTPTDEDNLVHAHMTMFSTREGFDSWQGYTIKFNVNTQGAFIKVAQLAHMAMQAPDDDGTDPGITSGLWAAQVAQVAMQAPDDDIDGPGGPPITSGVFVAQVAESAGQNSSFYTTMNRTLFEAPYALLAKLGEDPAITTLATVVARPSDRLTDSHSIWTRYDWPAGSGNMFSYDQVVAPSPFTPWITLDVKVKQLDRVLKIRNSSFFDGISLNDVKVGQVLQVDAEIMRVESVSETEIGVARGCFDTIPALHNANARAWFFETAAGNDPSNYPVKLVAGTLGAAVQVKMVPDVYGPPLTLTDVPTDRVNMLQRVARPYPPGQVMIGDKHWFEGGKFVEGESMLITWVHRNRVEQGANTIDHLAPGFNPEDNQTYVLEINLNVSPPAPAQPYKVRIRHAEVDGTSFEYTWEMIKADGYRSAAVLGVCGRVTVGLVLTTVRFGLKAWQNYTIPVLLPARNCPPGQNPGGGQLPSDPSDGGNGETNNPPDPGNTTPGGDNQGDGPGDPIDNGGQGDNGSGPPEPPIPPPDWPDPVDPPPPIDPGDPNPALKSHWDLNWDRHWDAYNKDNQGG